MICELCLKYYAPTLISDWFVNFTIVVHKNLSGHALEKILLEKKMSQTTILKLFMDKPELNVLPKGFPSSNLMLR